MSPEFDIFLLVDLSCYSVGLFLPDVSGQHIVFICNRRIFDMKRIHLVSKLVVVFLSTVILQACSERPALSNTATFLVSDYGAVGDGQTDDRPAILAAFAAAKAASSAAGSSA